jgi:biopolymer transport protein ExbD
MAAGGSKGGPQSNINMTPMIDILLVLLIIFMVVQQSLQKGVSVQVPPVKKEEQTPQTQNPDQIVLEVKRGQQYFLNRQPIPAQQLQARLTEVYAPRPRKVIFIKADEDVTYGDVIYAVDIARASNIEIVGLVPRPDAVVVPGA